MPRFTDRYGHQSARTCSTEGCSGTSKTINGKCHTCIARLRRFGDCRQTLPTTAELDRSIRAAEEERGALKNLDIGALEARWTTLVNDCRAKATPSFKDKGTLSYSSYEREAAQLLRDISEAITFTRVLDLLTAVHLLHLEGRWRSDEAMACSMVELLRRTSRVSCQVTAQNNHNGAIKCSWRRELGKNSRLAAARMLTVALGGACAALALRKSKRADQERAARTAYYDVVRSLEGEQHGANA
jgi:hypothetical protein